MQRKSQGTAPPEGFQYQPEVVPPDEEQQLVERIGELLLKEFEFHGYMGRRRVLSFGWHYDFGERKLQQTDEMSAFLHTLRERAAAFTELEPADLPHALVTEYSPGTTIGWHRIRASSSTWSAFRSSPPASFDSDARLAQGGNAIR